MLLRGHCADGAEAVGAVVNDIETAVRGNPMVVYCGGTVESPDAFDVAGERRDELVFTIDRHRGGSNSAPSGLLKMPFSITMGVI